MKIAFIPLKFLFWTIVAFLFIMPACQLGTELTNIGDDSVKSYSNLIGIIDPNNIDSVKDGETRSMAFSLNKKSVVVGFSKNSGQFENWKGNELKSVFGKPGSNGCVAYKACICLCQGYELDKKTKSAKLPCKDLLLCHPFDNINIVSEKEVNTDMYVSTGYKWKGGFLIHRDIDDSEDVNGLEKNNIGTRTFYVQRIKDIVGVCTISTIVTPCVP